MVESHRQDPAKAVASLLCGVDALDLFYRNS